MPVWRYHQPYANVVWRNASIDTGRSVETCGLPPCRCPRDNRGASPRWGHDLLPTRVL